ncbi:MAG TPA: hypothetical protein PLP17_11035, partial [Oligoflexia bacterium]|nr:hypothetical protein [Oligoflexia bacterium]
MDPFLLFGDLLFGAVRQINKRQLGLVGRTRLADMGITGGSREQLRLLLSERTGAEISVEEASRWETCQDVCVSLEACGGSPPESAEQEWS